MSFKKKKTGLSVGEKKITLKLALKRYRHNFISIDIEFHTSNLLDGTAYEGFAEEYGLYPFIFHAATRT